MISILNNHYYFIINYSVYLNDLIYYNLANYNIFYLFALYPIDFFYYILIISHNIYVLIPMPHPYLILYSYSIENVYLLIGESMIYQMAILLVFSCKVISLFFIGFNLCNVWLFCLLHLLLFCYYLSLLLYIANISDYIYPIFDCLRLVLLAWSRIVGLDLDYCLDSLTTLSA